MKKLVVWRSFSREFQLRNSGQWCYHRSWWIDLAQTGWEDKGGCFNVKTLEKGLMSVPVVVDGGGDD